MIEKTDFEGLFVLNPNIFFDKRGFFYEFYNQNKFFEQTGLKIDFIQDNLAQSSKGVLRGLHFQKGEFAQAKLVSVLRGKVLDVAVDIRKNSKTFGKYFSIILSEENKKQLFIPRGFAHGYFSLQDDTLFFYKIDNVYNKASEGGIRFNDKDLNIDWQTGNIDVLVSEKDKVLPFFKEIF